VIQKHPEVENKIICEIREILRQRGDSPTSKNESLFTVKELNNMVYLQAALSETLRLFPPIPMEMKQAIEDDVLPDGTFVRKGSRVYFSIYAMGRMESICR
jgi:fatty acid omega-hydroxylase